MTARLPAPRVDDPVEVFRPQPASSPELLRRSRPDGTTAWRFGGDGLEVLITRAVADQVLRHARAAQPDETIGLLAGRPMCDERGVYVLVCEANRAEASEHKASPGSVSFTADGGRRLRSRMLRLRPELDIVGWWHSQHTSTAYSAVDRLEQRTWPRAYHLGLVAAPDALGDPLAVYAGTESVLLEVRERPPELTADVAFRPAAPCGAPARVRALLRRALPAARTRWPLVAGVVVLALALAVWSAWEIRSLGGRVDRLEGAASAAPRAGRPPAAGEALSRLTGLPFGPVRRPVR